ncbi:MAG TPA: hypothetical protein VM871_04765 [Flavisolibacter sp.]|jgi:hypothetical protein|nr:hypothetical protein [Flavisolibacter sp.]
MRTLFFALCLFAFTFFASGQTSFPQSFLGHWQGTLLWYQAGKTTPQKVPMQLIVRPADSANTFTWQIIYGDKGQDNRPYVLKPVDTVKGHWQINEGNGIVLDQYLVGGRFTSGFTVQNTTIVDSYWRVGKTLVVEFHSLSAKPVATTGNGTEESPKVDSYGVKGFQRAVLYRKK